jgi:hypothetical protein
MISKISFDTDCHADVNVTESAYGMHFDKYQQR